MLGTNSGKFIIHFFDVVMGHVCTSAPEMGDAASVTDAPKPQCGLSLDVVKGYVRFRNPQSYAKRAVDFWYRFVRW